MSDLKLEAEALRRCLELRVIPVSMAVEWADRHIESMNQPLVQIIEVALAQSRSPEQVAELLAEVPGGIADPGEVSARVLARMYDSLSRDPNQAALIARALFQMALAGEAPNEDAEGSMFYFDDAYSLARDRIQGNVDEVRQQLTGFLRDFSDIL